MSYFATLLLLKSFTVINFFFAITPNVPWNQNESFLQADGLKSQILTFYKIAINIKLQNYLNSDNVLYPPYQAWF